MPEPPCGSKGHYRSLFIDIEWTSVSRKVNRFFSHMCQAAEKLDSQTLKLLVYVSSAVPLLSDEQLKTLLMKSRAANELAGITGLLVYVDGSVLQAIEGPASSIDALHQKLMRDPRHRGMIKLLEQSIDRRSFSDWSMGMVYLNREEIEKFEGLGRYLDLRAELTGEENRKLLMLLNLFVSGNQRYAA